MHRKNEPTPVFANFIEDGKLHNGRVIQNYRNGNLLVWTNEGKPAVWLVPNEAIESVSNGLG